MEEDVGPWKGTNSKVVRGSHPPLCKAFFNNEEFSDVKLFCGRKEYFGHKIILSSCSEVFRTMLSTAWCNVDHLTLEETSQAELVFEKFLEFLYTWEITLCEENVTALLMLADKYMVEELIALGIDYMMETLSPENVIPWYKFSLQFNIEALYKKCVVYLSQNFHAFCCNNELIKLEVDELIPILDSGSIITSSELFIFHTTLKWMKMFDRAIKDDIMDDVARLLAVVRFPMMTLGDLQIADNTTNLWTGPLEKLQLNLYKGYKFHLTGLTQEPPQEQSSNHERYYVPRIYTKIGHGCSLIRADAQNHVFHTPVHMSHMYQGSSIRWTYTKGKDCLKICFVHPIQGNVANLASTKVRFVAMTSKGVLANMTQKVIVKYDAIMTLTQNMTEVPLGFDVTNDEDVQKCGMILSIVPIPL